MLYSTLYPIMNPNFRDEVPVSLIEKLHIHENLCNVGLAQSSETRQVFREIERQLASLGMEWCTEDLVRCGHPYYKKWSATRFFISWHGEDYANHDLISYAEACAQLEKADQQRRELGRDRRSAAAWIVFWTEENQREYKEIMDLACEG